VDLDPTCYLGLRQFLARNISSPGQTSPSAIRSLICLFIDCWSGFLRRTVSVVWFTCDRLSEQVMVIVNWTPAEIGTYLFPFKNSS
jgi:hypothetical protein